MRILFVLSREVMFFHGSGEVEAKLLQVGIQLLGHECHIAGLDSGDFFDYDAYFLFSLRRDVIDLIEKIPQQRPCVVIPQVENMDAATAQELNRIAQPLEELILLGRSAEELERLRRCFPRRNCLLAEGWFLKPFIYEEKPPEYGDDQAGYCLCMVSEDRDEGIEDMADICLKWGKWLHVVSDRPSEHWQRLGHLENVTLKKRVAYGSLEWYMRLENCSSLYEPNPRLTCGVLEALWMGKKVFSPHAEYINSVLEADLVVDFSGRVVEQRVALSPREVQRFIYRFHANFMAGRIIDAIGIEAHA